MAMEPMTTIITFAPTSAIVKAAIAPTTPKLKFPSFISKIPGKIRAPKIENGTFLSTPCKKGGRIFPLKRRKGSILGM